MLDRCTHVLSTDNTRELKTPEDNETILAAIKEYNSHGLRTLVLAFRDLEPGFPSNEKLPTTDGQVYPLVEEKDLCVICVVAIKDPLK